jgi:hypothetical protein
MPSGSNFSAQSLNLSEHNAYGIQKSNDVREDKAENDLCWCNIHTFQALRAPRFGEHVNNGKLEQHGFSTSCGS